jgi:glycosyltransferase involved in cell wall biosynthesis
MTGRPPDRPLRVLTVLDHGAVGGGTLVAASLLRSWRACGVDASSSSLSWTTASMADLLGPDEHLALDRSGHVAKVLALRRLLARSQRPFDLVFCIGEYAGVVAVIARRLLRKARRPAIVVAEHQPALLEDLLTRGVPSAPARFIRLALRRARRAVDGWIGLTTTQMAERRAAGLVPTDRSTVIANPLLVEVADDDVIAERLTRHARHAKGSTGHVVRLITVGSVNEGKNHRLLLDVLVHLGQRFHLTVVGEGDRDELAEHAAVLGVAPRVELLGPRDDVTDLLDAADVFVLSSDYESFGLVLIEAMARGLPIVSTDCGPAVLPLSALSPAFRVVPVGDAAHMAEEIEALCVAEIPFEGLRTAARSVGTQHDAVDTAQAHLDFFAKVLAG